MESKHVANDFQDEEGVPLASYDSFIHQGPTPAHTSIQMDSSPEKPPLNDSTDPIYNRRFFHRDQHDEDRVGDFNGGSNIMSAYNHIAEYMPEFQTPEKQAVVMAIVAALVSTGASTYNFVFSGGYATKVAQQLGFDVESYKTFSSTMSLLVNVPINLRSILVSWDKFRDDLFERFDKNRVRLPNDSELRIIVGVYALLGGLGAIPAILFGIDAIGEKVEDNVGKIMVDIVLSAVQLISAGMQNVRGLTRLYDPDALKPVSVFNHRRGLLKLIASCLDEGAEHDYVDRVKADIEIMAGGNLTAPSNRYTPVIAKVVGAAALLASTPYSIAFGFSVINNLKKMFCDNDGKGTYCAFDASDPLKAGALVTVYGSLSLLSMGLKGALLGTATKALMERIIKIGDRNVFDFTHFEITDSTIRNKNARTATNVFSKFISFAVSFFSMPSPSQVVNNNFFNGSSSGTALGVSFGLAAAGTLAINGDDFNTTIELAGGTAKKLIDKVSVGYNKNARFLITHNQFLLKLMHLISSMTVSAFCRKFLTPFNTELEDLEQNRGDTPSRKNAIKLGENASGAGYEENEALALLINKLQILADEKNRLRNITVLGDPQPLNHYFEAWLERGPNTVAEVESYNRRNAEPNDNNQTELTRLVPK